MKQQLSAEQRFWAKVEKTTDCWSWLGTITRGGYGMFWLSPMRRMVSAHRYAYELVKEPIPVGLAIDHLCRNRRCVNPDHLEVVTSRENVLRGASVPADNHRKTCCVRGHALAGENLLIDKLGRRICVTCRRTWERSDKKREQRRIYMQKRRRSAKFREKMRHYLRDYYRDNREKWRRKSKTEV